VILDLGVAIPFKAHSLPQNQLDHIDLPDSRHVSKTRIFLQYLCIAMYIICFDRQAGGRDIARARAADSRLSQVENIVSLLVFLLACGRLGQK
jgi:hypothetical protein